MAQDSLDGMPARDYECSLSGSLYLDAKTFENLEVDQEVKITGTFIIRKVGLKHDADVGVVPFAAAQLDTGRASKA